MTPDDRFGRTLSTWLHEEAEHRVPGHLAEVLVQTVATRQRPWWSSLERLLPMTTMTTGRVQARPPVFWFALIALVSLAAVGAVLLAGSLRATPTPLGPASNGRIVVADGSVLYSYARRRHRPARARAVRRWFADPRRLTGWHAGRVRRQLDRLR